MQNCNAKKLFKLFEKIIFSLTVYRKPSFHNFRVISDQSKTSLKPKLRRFYDVFATSLRRLGSSDKSNRKRNIGNKFFSRYSSEAHFLLVL